MEIEGRVNNIRVSTEYGSGTSLGYGIKVGKIILDTKIGKVNCVFRGYTYYIELERGNRVRIKGGFLERNVGGRQERVFQVLEILNLETGETWKFIEHKYNYARFLQNWFISFIILIIIAMVIVQTITSSDSSSTLPFTILMAASRPMSSPADVFFNSGLVIVYFVSLNGKFVNMNFTYVAVIGFAAFLALAPSLHIEIKNAMKESYSVDKKRQERETLLRKPSLRGNVCIKCGAAIPEQLDTCPECGKIVIKCVLCKSNISPAKVCYCPHCNSPFHRDHLLEWVKVRGNCPHCGIRISQKEIHRFPSGNL